jgi:hypothetical protein
MTRPQILFAATLLTLQPALVAAAGPSATWTHGFDGSVQAVTESGSFWGLADVFAPGIPYDSSPSWLEASAKPWLAFEAPAGTWTAYGRVSVLGSGTLGTDVFAQGDSGRLELEDAYLGLRGTGAGLDWDLSAGSQSWRLGEGLLLKLGAGNGFERGAPALSPRTAWQRTVLVSARGEHLGARFFYLDPNELESSDSNTRLRGLTADWQPREGAVLGAAWFEVTRSDAPYPQAPVNILVGGREGLRTWTLHGRWAPGGGQMDGFSAWGEIAVQRNGRIGMEAWGGGADLGWRWGQARWRPRLSWSPRIYSGDDPGTPDRLERFDPLFYDGGPATWSSGSNGSFAFYNSDLRVHRVRLELTFSATDFANVSYYDVRADRANSPVQFGQAARLAFLDGAPVLVSGFPDVRLTHEWYIEHTHVFDANRFLTWGIAIADPRAGIRALSPDASAWVGGLVNFTVRY